MDDVYIVGAGMIRFSKMPDKSVKQMSVECLDALCKDTPVKKEDLEAAFFGNSGWGMQVEPDKGMPVGQHCIRGEVALLPAGIQGIPIMNVENACAGGSNAVHAAWMSVKAGVYDLVLAVGVEKLYFPDDRKRMFDGFLSGTDVEVTAKIVEAMKAQARQKAEEMAEQKGEAPAKEKQRSSFMDIYATGARMHMKSYGSTQEQLAVIAAKNHYHGSMNPMAQFQKDMSVEEVLADTPVAYPLTRSMCAPIGDGAAALILASEKMKNKLGSEARPVKIRASVILSGRFERPDGKGIGERLGERAYNQAGVGPEDISLAELHDATAFGELMQTEELGFAEKGRGGELAESGATRLGGRIPINTSGGLECRGHPIGATGAGQLIELVAQLRGEAGKRQVENARLALAENGGGFIGTEEAAMSIHILEK
ncbi:MAG: thiolase family protein [bacterium]